MEIRGQRVGGMVERWRVGVDPQDCDSNRHAIGWWFRVQRREEYRIFGIHTYIYYHIQVKYLMCCLSDVPLVPSEHVCIELQCSLINVMCLLLFMGFASGVL